jgi:uncharacterized membrane protein YcaP (DUF421 family)
MKETSCSKGIRVLIYVHYFGYIQILCILLSTLFTIQEVVESLIYGTPTVIFEQ